MFNVSWMVEPAYVSLLCRFWLFNVYSSLHSFHILCRSVADLFSCRRGLPFVWRMSFEYTYLYKSISSSNKIEKSAPQQIKARSIFYDIMTGHRRKLITYLRGGRRFQKRDQRQWERITAKILTINGTRDLVSLINNRRWRYDCKNMAVPRMRT